MKYLITGISGFVAGHYLEYLAKNRPDARVFGLDERRPSLGFIPSPFRRNISWHRCSLLDRKKTQDILRKTSPDYIVHLASYSSVAFSWKDPVACFVNNTNIFLNIVEAVRKLGMRPRILSVGSSEEYGIVRAEDLPLREDLPLNPISPYAVARVSQEAVSRVYARGYGLDIICTRSFNHIGPRQSEIFAVSSFAKQVAGIRSGRRREIVCGDLDIVRDLVDVRDVVGAYDLLLEKGRTGEVYNVCSGQGRRLSDVVALLQKIAGTAAPLSKDPSLVRPVDNPAIIGSCGKLAKEASFKPSYTFEDSLRDILEYWEAHGS